VTTEDTQPTEAVVVAVITRTGESATDTRTGEQSAVETSNAGLLVVPFAELIAVAVGGSVL